MSTRGEREIKIRNFGKISNFSQKDASTVCVFFTCEMKIVI